MSRDGGCESLCAVVCRWTLVVDDRGGDAGGYWGILVGEVVIGGKEGGVVGWVLPWGAGKEDLGI